MKRSLFVVAFAGTALLSLPFEARAQVANPVHFGVAAGAAVPTSDLSNATNTGFNVTGTVGIDPQMIPLGIRVDVAYNRFGVKNNSAGITGDFHFTSVTGNLVYSIPSTGVSPYLIGGAGLFGPQIDFNTPLAQDYIRAANHHWLADYHVDGCRYDDVR